MAVCVCERGALGIVGGGEGLSSPLCEVIYK